MTIFARRHMQGQSYIRDYMTYTMVQFCAEIEQSAKDMAAIAGNPNTHSVDAVNIAKSDYVKQKLKAKQPKSDSTTSHATPNKTCQWCGKPGGNCYPRKTTCPAWNHTCEKCGRQGHKGNVCRVISQEQTNIDSLSMDLYSWLGVLPGMTSIKFVACHSARKPRSIIHLQMPLEIRLLPFPMLAWLKIQQIRLPQRGI